MKVICSNLKCKYFSNNFVCKAKKIELILNGVNTKNQGFKDYLECKNFEKSNSYKNVEKLMKDLGIIDKLEELDER